MLDKLLHNLPMAGVVVVSIISVGVVLWGLFCVVVWLDSLAFRKLDRKLYNVAWPVALIIILFIIAFFMTVIQELGIVRG